MTPTKTWKANKWRIDLRKYTREFQQKFESTKKINLFPGCIYAATYSVDHTFLTDKHHFTPLFVSFGRFRDDDGKVHVRGANLFYLRKEQQLELLDEVFKYYDKKPDARVAPLVKLHQKWMKIVPFAFKNFEERRIIGIEEVSSSEWGMIPLLHSHLYGNFNPVALNEDFQKENLRPVKETKQKPVKLPEKIEEVESVSIEMVDGEIDLDELDFDDDI